MKKFAVLSMLAMSLCVSAFADGAISGHPTYSVLTVFKIEGERSTAGMQGTVGIDPTSRTARLSVTQHPICAPGMMCPQFLRLVFNVELPIVNVTTEKNGARTYTAALDLRTRDGGLQKLQIRDNTNVFSTSNSVALPVVQVRYFASSIDHQTGKETHTRAYFEGMVPMFAPMSHPSAR